MTQRTEEHTIRRLILRYNSQRKHTAASGHFEKHPNRMGTTDAMHFHRVHQLHHLGCLVFPNITGYAGIMDGTSNSSGWVLHLYAWNGALQAGETTAPCRNTSYQPTGNSARTTLILDANKCVSTYVNDGKITPKSLTFNHVIKV